MFLLKSQQACKCRSFFLALSFNVRVCTALYSIVWLGLAGLCVCMPGRCKTRCAYMRMHAEYGDYLEKAVPLFRALKAESKAK